MEKKPIRLIIDEENMTTKMDRGEEPPVNVVEVSPEQIVGLDIKIAMNGGFAIHVTYNDGKSPDTLIFTTKDELLAALGNILK